jgi:hypothetical protein
MSGIFNPRSQAQAPSLSLMTDSELERREWSAVAMGEMASRTASPSPRGRSAAQSPLVTKLAGAAKMQRVPSLRTLYNDMFEKAPCN